MRTFLFEQYGYYPKEISDNTFYIKGWIFKLIETNLIEEKVSSIEEYINIVNNKFNNKGPYIIKNKFNSNISVYNQKKYVLVSTYSTSFSYKDLIDFHYLFLNEEEYVELDKILETWKERINNIEGNLSSYLRIDSIYYKSNLDISMFCIGLAINAMQYLSDIIHNYDDKMYGVGIVHKRLKDLNSFDFLNPFNYIVEHPVKDLVMLYQKDYLSFEEFIKIISNYKLDIISATFLIARILYRVDVFDELELKRDLEIKNQRLNFNITKELSKIKKAYSYLKEKYSIRPIEWLD